MKLWLITYTPDKSQYDFAYVKAPTYTTALVQFMREYPNCEYTGVFEVLQNESAFA